MRIVKVKGLNKDFYNLCKKLEEYQFKLLPILKEKDYSLTDDLQDITGYVLYIDNIPIGSIGLKKISDETCEIVRVFVDDSFRGKGYAIKLFDKIEKLAKDMGYKRLEMVAWVSAETALKLYKKLKYNFGEEKISEWYGGFKYIELFKNI